VRPLTATEASDLLDLVSQLMVQHDRDVATIANMAAEIIVLRDGLAEIMKTVRGEVDKALRAGGLAPAEKAEG
jgi:hypothetical protein